MRRHKQHLSVRRTMAMPCHHIYLAGPMRGYPEFNFPAFLAAAERLRVVGHEVFNPAERDIEDGFDYRDLAGTMEELAELDFDLRAALGADTEWICSTATAITVLPGWEKSSGARAEVALGRALGLPIFDYASGFEIPPDAAPSTSTEEVRTTNALTGGEKGTKPARYDLIPARPLDTLARLYGAGAEKYAERNWERGYEWSKSFAALQRHAWAFWAGEDIDADRGLPHLAAVAWHAFALLEWAHTHPELDDRPIQGADGFTHTDGSTPA